MTEHTEHVDALAPTCEHGPLVFGCPACDAEAVRRLGAEYMAARDARLLAEVEPEWGPNLLAMSPEDRAGWVALKRRAEAAEAELARLRHDIEAAIGAHSFGHARPEWKTEHHNGAHDVVRVDHIRAVLAAERDPEAGEGRG